MDAGLIALTAIALAFLVLAGLAVRKIARGEIHGEPKKELPEPGDEELEAEALGKAPPAVPPEAAPTPTPTPAPAPSPLGVGLARTRQGFMARVQALIFGRGLEPALIDELEEVLVTSDIGIRTAAKLIGDLRESLSKKEISDPEAVYAKLKERVLEIISVPCPPLSYDKKPTVLMVIGVNGVGKTTTIGKLAARLVREGKQVVIAAGDTFRAAAVEQLEIWAQRAGATLVRGPETQDPSAVMFDAIQRAQRDGANVCIADTAGRLHNKVNLMEELKKVRRVMDKAHPGSPHEVILVLDATTGQNGITQAKQFTQAVTVNSLALTKLDGTAKGGVVVAIADELGLPVRYIGVGESVDDLRDFDPREFVDAMFAREK
ncbi:MAG: signal recognition particle-docking protein FtsY [Deltaproteobacteria bacterium]|nr:signal recognition particle-docking protein FtsY [Deltaproteobacteria bacterium]